MLTIENPRAHELARELAAAEGVSLTDAVLRALQEKADRLQAERDLKSKAKLDRARNSIARLRAALDPSGPPLGRIADDMYVDNGLPR